MTTHFGRTGRKSRLLLRSRAPNPPSQRTRRALGFTSLIGQRLESRLVLSAVINVAGNYTINSFEDVGFQENEVATFEASVNGQPDPKPGDFSAQIDWGDGGQSTGSIVYLGTSGSFADFEVKGSHVYQQLESNLKINVTVTGQGGTDSAQTAFADVAAMPSGITATMPTAYGSLSPANVVISTSGNYTVSSFAGVGFQENEVATISVSLNGQPDSKLSDLHAQINYGDDASWSAGDLVYLGNSGSFANYEVKGTHVYANANTNIPIVVYVNGPDGTSASGKTAFANVSNMPSGIAGTKPAAFTTSAAANVVLSTSGNYTVNSYAGVGFQENEVATVSISLNGQPDSTLSDLHAQISFGDDASWLSADLVYLGDSGSFSNYEVKGSHVYSKAGTNIPIVVYVNGPDGTSASNQTAFANVANMPSGIPGTQPANYSASAPEAVVISVSGNYTINAETGLGFKNQEVATMSVSVNSQPDDTLGDFHAQINFGDDATWVSGTLILLGDSGAFSTYEIEGSHTYKKTGSNIPIVVYVNGPDGTSASGRTGFANVAPNPNTMSATALPVAATEGDDFSGAVAVFTDTDTTAKESDFSATITWADGTTSDGDISESGDGFKVSGDHKFDEEGTQPFSVAISGNDGTSATAIGVAIVADAALDATFTPISATEGSTFSGAVATFTDDDPKGAADDYTATITWGDGASGPGTITKAADGFSVSGSHVFSEEGTSLVRVAIKDAGGSSASVSGSADITDAPLTATGSALTTTEGATLSTVVATFSDADPLGAASDYTATIAWGDGSITSGSIGSSAGGFNVSGDHSYALPGDQTITVTVSDAGGSRATATSTVTIATAPITLGSLDPSQYTENQPGYTGVIAIQGGTGTYQNPQVSGLPSGLSAALSGSLILITGTPAQSGTFNLSASIDDNAGHSGVRTETLIIQPAAAGSNPPVNLEVNTDGPVATTNGTIPIDITAVGGGGATSGGDSGPATVLLQTGVSTSVYLHNGTGRAFVPAPSQPGSYSVHVTQQPSPGITLNGSIQINVQASNESNQLTASDVGAQAAGVARGVAETLKELLESTIEDSTAFEKEALESLEGLANKLGWAATKKAELIPLAIHLVALFNDYHQHNEEQFGKDFSNVIEDSLDAATGIGLKLITATSPVGAVGGLVLGGVVTIGVKAFYSNFLEKGMETEGQKLYTALSGQGESVLTQGGTEYAPGAGDPPPAIIINVPAQDSATQVANLTAAGQALYAAVSSASSDIVATFTDATGGTDPGRYQAYVAWGDGNFTPGTVSASAGGGFSVSASNTYAASGLYTVTVVLVSSDGSTATVYDPMTVYQPPSGNQAPRAMLLAPDVTAENAGYLAPYTFDVVYQSSASISASSLPNSTLEIIPPGQPPLLARQIASQALGTVDAFGDAQTIVVTFQATPPAGQWAAAPAGTYNVVLGGAPVTDLVGKAVAAGVLGTFNVNVPPLITLSSSSGTDVQNSADVSTSATLNLTGYAQANSQVSVFNGNAAVGSVTSGPDGSYTFNYTAPADGLYDFTVTASSAGVASQRSLDELVQVDTAPPTSSVTALPASSPPTFTVNWSGSDGPSGSGIASYDVYVSDNGGPFTPLAVDSFATSASFTGQVGHTYGFYSVATDLAGLAQPTPATPQATTTVSTALALSEDIYVISSGTITVSAAHGVLANDTGLEPLTVTSTTVSGAEGGTFVFHADGSFTYTPPPSKFPGFDYASYTAQDASGEHATATVNVLSQIGGVVWKFYEQVLDRDPEYAGLQFWINDFTGGGKTGDIAVGFFESTELLNQIITGYYLQYLGRAPQGNDLPYWEDVWRKNGGPELIKAQFASSPEFNSLAIQQYGAFPDGWLEALYHRILGRPPQGNDLPFWEQKLAAGTTEGQVTLDFFTSPEADSGDVTGWFNEYLGRTPTAAELSQYINQILAGASDRDIEQAITNLPEYAANPPASPPGTGVRLPDYFPAKSAAKSQASIAASDAVFAKFT